MNGPNGGHIVVITGEPSGDVHAATLVREIKRADPYLTFSGIGGENLKASDVDLFYHIRDLSAMGVTEVMFQVRNIHQAFSLYKRQLKRRKPDLVILVDYPGFNLKAAEYAKKNSIRVLYYISPKIWAWKYGRIKKIKKYVDHMSLILPFEEKIYRKASVPATFVGHPLLDSCPEINRKPEKKRDGRKTVVGLLPGSRASEVTQHLELMLKAACFIKDRKPETTFLLSIAQSVDFEKMADVLEKYNRQDLFQIVKGAPESIFRQSDLLVAASGTVTLEAAIYRVPMIIVYRMSKFSYAIARRFVKVQYAGLANIIAGREIVPELIQEDARVDSIVEKVISLMEEKRLSRMRHELLTIRNMLGGKGASRRTANIAVQMAGR
ncbi:MAG: lipid-A-disaccharide synthase [Desulfarculaceae bacterium]|nr:lipid-A-disaccharide synthase [Desulfarculaceae bacterium]